MTFFGVVARLSGLPRSQFFDPLGEQHGAVDDQHRDDDVEGDLQGVGMPPNTSRVIGESSCCWKTQRGDARQSGDHGEGDADDQDEGRALERVSRSYEPKATRVPGAGRQP